MTFQDLEKRVLALPPAEREQLGQVIFDSLQELPLVDVEQAWVQEAEQRLTELLAGTTAGLTHDEVIGDIKREMGWHS